MRLVLRQKLDCERDGDGVAANGKEGEDRKRAGADGSRRPPAGAMLQLVPGPGAGAGAAGGASLAVEPHRARAQSRGRQARSSEDRSIMVTLVRLHMCNVQYSSSYKNKYIYEYL